VWDVWMMGYHSYRFIISMAPDGTIEARGYGYIDKNCFITFIVSEELSFGESNPEKYVFKLFVLRSFHIC